MNPQVHQAVTSESHTPSNRPEDLSPLLVIGSGDPVMRGYCLRRAAHHHPVLLIDSHPPTWQRAYIVDHETVDLRDPLAVMTAADSLAERWNITGVVTWDEYHLLTTARIAERLGLPGNSPYAVLAARDKALSRLRCSVSGVPSPRASWVTSPETAANAAEQIGYPVVLKPTAHAGSVGVTRVDSAQDLDRGWKAASAGVASQGPEGHGVMVEEYLDGPEVSVETVTDNGETTVVAVTRKRLGFAPFFLETGHTVVADDPLLETAAPVAQQALEALGITHGVSHVELRLTDRGPHLIEVNARQAGDLIGELVLHATGVDLARAAADLACGLTPDVKPTRRAAAAIEMFYPAHEGTLTSHRLPPGTSDTAMERLQWLRKVGDDVTLTPSSAHPNNTRLGFAIVTGRTAAETQRAVDDINRRIKFAIRPAMPN
ncbi:ATP-grasp domain-containing protein [Streptomyces sp. MS1.AVA.3]|uniref:ATP-grasp domain-containing protein n=1 Tax=Streptomyces decoyicus TaxID=249567 RepID=UPI0030BA9925